METPNQSYYSVELADAAVDKAFNAILIDIKGQLSLIQSEQLRTCVEKSADGKVCNFFSPIVNISVDDLLGTKQISYAINFGQIAALGSKKPISITNCLHKYIYEQESGRDIEDRFEEYAYNTQHFEDALLASQSNRNYRKFIVTLTQAEHAQLA